MDSFHDSHVDPFSTLFDEFCPDLKEEVPTTVPYDAEHDSLSPSSSQDIKLTPDCSPQAPPSPSTKYSDEDKVTSSELVTQSLAGTDSFFRESYVVFDMLGVELTPNNMTENDDVQYHVTEDNTSNAANKMDIIKSSTKLPTIPHLPVAVKSIPSVPVQVSPKSSQSKDVTTPAPPSSPGVYLSESQIDVAPTPKSKLTHDSELTKQNRELGAALKSSVPKRKKEVPKTDRNSIEARRDTFRDRTEKLGFVQTGIAHSYNQYVKGSLLVAERPQKEGLSGRFLVQKCGDFPNDVVGLPSDVNPNKDLTQIKLDPEDPKNNWKKKKFATPKATIALQRAGFNWRMNSIHNRLCNASQTINTGFYLCFLVDENGKETLRYFNFGGAMENNRVTMFTADNKYYISEILPLQILKAKAEMKSFLKSPEPKSRTRKCTTELFLKIQENSENISAEDHSDDQFEPTADPGDGLATEHTGKIGRTSDDRSGSSVKVPSLLAKSLCIAADESVEILETPKKVGLKKATAVKRTVKRKLDLGKVGKVKKMDAKRTEKAPDALGVILQAKIRYSTVETDHTEDIIDLNEAVDETEKLIEEILPALPKSSMHTLLKIRLDKSLIFNL